MKNLKIIITIIILLYFATSIFAESAWTQYPCAQNIQDIAFEGQYVWCATDGGVIRWNKQDGTHTILTTNYGLANNYVKSVFVDSDGVKWFGTDNGVTKYDGTSCETITEGLGLINSQASLITQDKKGNMWIGLGDGLSKFDGVTWTHYTPENGFPIGNITAITVDKNNIIWIGTSCGIVRFDGTTLKTYTEDDGLADDNISGLVVGPDGTIWASTEYGGGLSSFDGISWKNYNVLNSAISIDIDNDGVIWLGSSETICSFNGKVLSSFSNSFQNKINDVYIVAVDNEGIKWIGSNFRCGSNPGLSSFDGQTWKHHSINSVINNMVNTVTVDHDNTKWFGTYCGISSFDGAIWTNYTPEQEIDVNKFVPFTVYDAGVDLDNTKWFTTRYGVKSYNGFTWKTYTNNDSISFDRFYHDVVIDRNNMKWFAAVDGVWSFDGIEWKRFTVDDGLIYNCVNTIAVDNNNNLWFGTDYGISSFDGIHWMNFTEETGMPSAKVTSIAVDKNNVKWFGGSTIMNFDGNIWEEHTFDVTPFESLCGGVAMAVDNKGVVWAVMQGICSGGGYISSGIASYDGTSWTTYKDIFPGWPFTATAIKVDENNVKWFATGNGAISYDDKPGNAVEETEICPKTLAITGNYPNPFNPSTTIEFAVPKSGFVNLVIYNVLGQQVRNLLSKIIPAGTHTVVWNGKDDNGKPVSSGIYLSLLKTGDITAAHRMVMYK
ncbi:MAG: T9SS type A sorting domain-containing protein [Candidatus Latescibacteria bacterium]|nr:T9SS type A sorting domain-containing protein [Candidatus Latescibacterota bacterium]